MTHNWDYKPIGDCFVYIKNGANISQAKDSGGIPITRIETLSNGLFNRSKMGYANILEPGKYAQNVLNDGDLLMSHINSKSYIGRTVMYEALPNEVIIHGMNLLRLVPNETTLSKFFYYFTLSHYFKSKIVKIRKDAVNQSSISITDLKKINIPVPPLAEQQQIVAELDKINETIEDCRELLRNLDALAQSLFYDTFGDPTTFHNRWEISTLGENCTFIGGGTPSKSNADFYSGNIPWATVRDMSNFLLSSTELKITEEAIKLSATNLLPKGTIVISTHVGLGKICKLMQDTAINQDLKGVILNERLIDTFFVYWYLNMAPHIIANGRGATVKGVTLDFMRSLKIPVPPLELQEKFAERIEQIEAQKKVVESTIAELQTLLDSRMDYWFN